MTNFSLSTAPSAAAPPANPSRRRRFLRIFDAVAALAATAAVLGEATRWWDGPPDLRPVAIAALLAIPWLVRNSIPVASGTYTPTIALTPAALFASGFDGSAHSYPLWALVCVATYALLSSTPTIRNPRIAIQLLAGWALVFVASHTHVGPQVPYGRLATGLLAYLATTALLEFARHRIGTGRSRKEALSPRHLVASIVALAGASCGAAVLRWMQPPVDGFRSGTDPGVFISGSLVVMGGLLFAACALVSVVERHLVTITTLTDAAVTMPWPDTEIDTTLVSLAQRGVRARRAMLCSDAGEKHTISIEMRDHRHLVLSRDRGDVGFRRAERRLALALVTMAETSKKQAAHEASLAQAAQTDALTGLWRFNFFRGCVTTALVEQAPGSQIAVLFIDLDNFTQLNARLGHLHADEVLQTLGARLLSRLPVDAFPSRFGGDKFVLLFRNVHGSSHLESLRHSVSSLVAEHMTIQGELIQVSCSIGCAVSKGTSSDNAKELLQEAEVTMRRAKSVRRAVPQPRWAPESVVLGDLVDSGSIGIALQPLADLGDGSLHGYELLLRAHHPDFGALPPLQTIESAIKMGLLDDVTQIAAEQGFVAITELTRKVGHELNLSINIEYQQLREDSALLNWICRQREETGVPVTLELSERKIGAWHAVHDHVARGLRDRGVSLAVDDFGAGNATFGVLSHWHWDWVKLDRAFLSTMGPRGRSMLPHVVRMLDDLGINTVLEGIETREQLELARGLGIAVGQGYRLGLPLSPDETLRAPGVHGLGPTDLLDS